MTMSTMTAPALTVRRFSVRVAGSDEDGRRVDRLLRRLVDQRLDAAMATGSIPAGHWCLQRLDVPVVLDLTAPEPASEAQWADAVAAALTRALREGAPGVVHYRGDLDALTDLVLGVSVGRTTNAWAWRRLGLLTDADPSPSRRPGATVLAALRRRPELAAAAVVAAIAAHGATAVAALTRMLDADGWRGLAAVLVEAAGGPTLDNPPSPGRLASPRTSALAGADDAGRPASRLADDALRRSSLVESFRRARVRPDPPTAWVWAVLAVVDSDPATLRRGDAVAVLGRIAERFAQDSLPPRTATHLVSRSERSERHRVGRPTTAPSPAPAPAADPGRQAPPETAPITPGSPAAGGPAAGGPARDGPARGEQAPDAPARGLQSAASQDVPPCAADGPEVTYGPDGTGATVWGGLPFLLATASDAGVPDDVLDDPVLAARPLRWVLQAVGVRLVPSDPEDPAVRALAGLGPTDPSPRRGTAPVDAAEQERLDEISARWASATRRRLEPDRDTGDARSPTSAAQDTEAVHRIATRDARVVGEQGCLDIHLDLDDVDLTVRRAGLDLDPGWVPWLGTVMRFRYG